METLRDGTEFSGSVPPAANVVFRDHKSAQLHQYERHNDPAHPNASQIAPVARLAAKSGEITGADGHQWKGLHENEIRKQTRPNKEAHDVAFA